MNEAEKAEPTPFEVPNKARSRTSDVLRELAEQMELPTTSLRRLSERFGDRTFGMLLIIIAIISVLPLISFVAGILIFMLGGQMLMGKVAAWLPKAVLDYQLNGLKVKNAFLAFAPRVSAFEKYIRPRWQITEAPIVDRLNGLVIMLLGATIAVPLPLTNIGPALVINLMGLGLMERDGLVQVASLFLAMLTIALLYFFVFSLL